MNSWQFFTIATLFTWGVWGFASKLASNSVSPKPALLFQCVGVMVFSLVVLAMERFRVSWSTPGFGWAFLAGFFAFVGFLTYLAALQKGPTSVVVVVSALYPLVTIILSLAVLHERLNLRQGIGIALAVVAAVILSF
jgi:bacterial/archaeal transporter family protein